MAQLNTSQKIALITGITGQDGSYMADLLVTKGYKVIGLTRKKTQSLNKLLEKISPKIEIIEVNYFNFKVVEDLIKQFKPDEIYNFAAYSTGSGMFDHPMEIGQINGYFVHQLIEAIRLHSPKTHLVQASSREIFGMTNDGAKLHEESPKNPISPYGVAKLYADNMIKIYRQQYGIHCSSAILFNHESPLRGPSFVTRKIASAVAKIKSGKMEFLELGSLKSRRDWGYAGDYVHAMWLMAQAPVPKDYVIATGEDHSIEDFCRLAFSVIGLDGLHKVKLSDKFARSVDTPLAVGDSAAIRRDLNWQPLVSFEQLVRMMVEAELDSVTSP